MKRFAAVAVGMVGLCANAFGGIVLFAPEEILSEPGQGGNTPVAMAFIGNGGSGVTFDAFDVMVGSSTVPMSGFAFGTDITANFPNQAIAEPAGFGIYTNEIYASANRSTPQAFTQVAVSTFNLDLSGLGMGDHLVEVNPDLDGALSALINRGVSDPLAGGLPIRVVPEPATLSLFAVGALAAAIRFGRRRTA